MKRRVVITGLGTVNPLGNNVEDFWSALCAGRSGIGPISRFDATDFQTRIAGEVKDFDALRFVSKKELRRYDDFIVFALAGAELILMPIAGGSQTLGKARAIENHVFLASSGYQYPTEILDPDGETLARAERRAAAVAKIDLNRRYPDSWLGEMRNRFMKEARFDVPVDPGYPR